MSDSLTDRLRRVARPLSDDHDLDPLLDRIGDAHIVMLGEASHGTSEYYTWRDRISRRLITERDFNFIAVEGDWPDCYTVNRFVKGLDDGASDARDVLHAFSRWPTWMWANEEVVELTRWLRSHNSTRPAERQVGFYGLDVYSLWDSMHAVLEYLDRVDPDGARAARRAYGCFDPYRDDAQEYAMATAVVPTSCEDETIAILQDLRRNAPHYSDDGRDAYFDAEQNALVARNAELYYRTMVRGGSKSWNVRDTHMAETLERLLAHHGTDAKGIVWEHNTHIGDAGATDMAAAGMTNIGQIARETWGQENVVLVGFGGYEGSVIAAGGWGEPMERMRVPPARDGSWEALLHDAIGEDTLLLSSDLDRLPGMREQHDHRAIGVVYHPSRERYGNYVPTVLPARYDAFIHIEQTSALDPLHMPVRVDGEVPETYPTGE
ncbi:MAG TPA: erythromycin esterase family protein [Longimicrobiales bacterium]|nr:erythromycin esterase family protein [Longimicrobiales bacterium]